MLACPTHGLKGSLVLVTADGENFRRTRIAEITPSGRYVRLEDDEPTPGGLQRWRALASIQLLETYTSSTSLPDTHGVVRLKKSPGPFLPPFATPRIDSLRAENSNVVPFPLFAASKIEPAHAAHST